MTELKLEPEITQYINYCEKYEVSPLTFNNVDEQRRLYNAMRAGLAQAIPESLQIEDKTVQGAEGHQIPIRVYRNTLEGLQPCCLFFHGGGFVVGNIETHNDFVAELAHKTGVTIISVDYRLSPEHHYPVALHDCRDVLIDVVANPDNYGIDKHKIAVSGDSAGGTLAAGLSLLSRDDKLADIKSQLLIYPWFGGGLVDIGREVVQKTAPLLPTDDLGFYAKAYMGEQTEIDKYAAPLLELDYSSLPSTFMLTVEHDAIRDDGFIFTERLSSAGIAVEHYDAKGLVHGCMQARYMCPQTSVAFQKWVDALKQAFS